LNLSKAGDHGAATKAMQDDLIFLVKDKAEGNYKIKEACSLLNFNPEEVPHAYVCLKEMNKE
jgi:hypothetical protein